MIVSRSIAAHHYPYLIAYSYYENGKSSPLHALQNENVRAEDDMEYRRQYTRIKLNNPNPDIECLKLVDESNGKMVAFVQWGFIDEVRSTYAFLDIVLVFAVRLFQFQPL